MESQTENQAPLIGKNIPENSGLENLIQKLPEYAPQGKTGDYTKLAEYIKQNYLKLIDAAYTSKEDQEISSLLKGL